MAFGFKNKESVAYKCVRDAQDVAYYDKDHVMHGPGEQEIKGSERTISENRIPTARNKEFDFFFVLFKKASHG